MNIKDAIRTQFKVSDFMVERFLSDLTPEELLARPVPGANHIAWQLGHLISAETRLIETAAPGMMPALPAGFAERHTKDTATSDRAVAAPLADGDVPADQRQPVADFGAA